MGSALCKNAGPLKLLPSRCPARLTPAEMFIFKNLWPVSGARGASALLKEPMNGPLTGGLR